MKGTIMNTKLVCKITKKTVEGSDLWEGQVSLQGAKPTKLTKSKTGETTFGSKSSLSASARAFAERLGFDSVEFTDSATNKLANKESKPNKTRTQRKQTEKTSLDY